MKNENEAGDKAPHLLPTIMQMGVSFTWRVLADYRPDRYFKNSASVADAQNLFTTMKALRPIYGLYSSFLQNEITEKFSAIYVSWAFIIE